MSSGPPPNAPTGPRIPTGSRVPTGPRTPQMNNNGPWVPNPSSLHSHIMGKKHIKEYPAMTIISSPPGTRTPLEQRPDMDTRPCMQPSSRTHLLKCGHHIAVNTAEACATNCDHDEIKKIDKSSSPKPLLTDGDFDCDTCGTQGARVAFAALFYPRLGYSCVVVGRDDRDRAAIAALRGGMVPMGSMNRDGDGGRGRGIGYLGNNPRGAIRGAIQGRGIGPRGAMHAGRGSMGGRGDRGRGSGSGSGMGRGGGSSADSSIRAEWVQKVQESDNALRLRNEAERLREEAELAERARKIAIEDKFDVSDEEMEG